MKLSVLGPLMIDGTEVSQLLTAPKPRRVLAMLMLEPNRAVSTAQLIQELWRENPPRSALTTLQTYILQVRRMLRTLTGDNAGGTGSDALITRLPGYLLKVADNAHDLKTYEDLVAKGQHHRAERDYVKASATLSQALHLWRGEALADVNAGPVLELHIRRLEESRLVVTELRIEAELKLGRHHEVLSELTRLIGQHPMHEGLQAQYMIALLRSGRLPAALDSFHRFRNNLIRDMGLEPSARLRELHHAILSEDPESRMGRMHSAGSFNLAMDGQKSTAVPGMRLNQLLRTSSCS